MALTSRGRRNAAKGTNAASPSARPHKPDFSQPPPRRASTAIEARVFFYLRDGTPLRRTGANGLTPSTSGPQPIAWPIEALPIVGEFIASDPTNFIVHAVAHELPKPGLQVKHVWLDNAPNLTVEDAPAPAAG